MDSKSDLVRGLSAADVDGVVAGAAETHDAVGLLRAAFDRETDPDRQRGIGALGTAMSYRLVEPAEADAALVHGVWGPMLRYADGTQIPPPPNEIDDESLNVWERAATSCTQPILLARVADLCWTLRRRPRPDQHARRAVESYLTLASMPRDEPEGLRQAKDARRALQISRELNNRDLQMKAEITLVSIVERDLDSGDPAPGITLGALQPMIDHCDPSHLNQVVELARRAFEAFADNPWAYESSADLLGRRVSKEGRQALRQQVVSNWVAAADFAPGIVGFSHRQHALELAKTFGLVDEAETIRVSLQGLDPESLGMRRVHHEGRLEGVDEMIAAYVTESFTVTLLNLPAFGPPSGDPEHNLQQVEEQRRVAPLQAMLPRTLVGVANSTIWHAAPGTPERDRYDLARTERFRISYTVSIFDVVLREARARYGDPTRDDLVSALASELIPPAAVPRLADAILAILADDFDTGVNVALPRIEAIVRELVRRCDRPITQEPRGEAPGGVRTLGGLLDELRGLLDEGWRRYLVNALTEPLGLNLRNRALHGLVDSASREEGIVILHIVAFLASLRPDERPTQRRAGREHRCG